VAAGTTRIYASWSYQVPDPVTYRYTWYYEGNEFFTAQNTLKETAGTMRVGTWYTDYSRLATGSWKFELKTMDDKILLTETCIIR
jgi:hypothetical protein